MTEHAVNDVGVPPTSPARHDSPPDPVVVAESPAERTRTRSPNCRRRLPRLVGPGGKPDLSVRCRWTVWSDCVCLHGRRSESGASSRLTGFNRNKVRCSPHLSDPVAWTAMICGIAGIWLVPGLWLSAVVMRTGVGPTAWLGTRIGTTLAWYALVGPVIHNAGQGARVTTGVILTRRRRPRPLYLWVLRSVCHAGLQVPGCGSSCLRSSEVSVPRR